MSTWIGMNFTNVMHAPLKCKKRRGFRTSSATLEEIVSRNVFGFYEICERVPLIPLTSIQKDKTADIEIATNNEIFRPRLAGSFKMKNIHDVNSNEDIFTSHR
ncbi:hypothetical protein RF11_16147 [Thelohanellus kitauei]|uniref:Uncharacterized protein n=1 Tax=Thelohanellus kitauei TaxID=669202 RepID=A0A0C2N2Q4_THEKT|nr:hypothetical protein RF11_16147 [Thelohanellus kitauei]